MSDEQQQRRATDDPSEFRSDERVNEREDGGAVIVLGGRGRGTRINVSPDGKRE